MFEKQIKGLTAVYPDNGIYLVLLGGKEDGRQATWLKANPYLDLSKVLCLSEGDYSKRHVHLRGNTLAGAVLLDPAWDTEEVVGVLQRSLSTAASILNCLSSNLIHREYPK